MEDQVQVQEVSAQPVSRSARIVTDEVADEVIQLVSSLSPDDIRAYSERLDRLCPKTGTRHAQVPDPRRVA